MENVNIILLISLSIIIIFNIILTQKNYHVYEDRIKQLKQWNKGLRQGHKISNELLEIYMIKNEALKMELEEERQKNRELKKGQEHEQQTL